MMVCLKATIIAALAAVVASQTCPNRCSGHGVCSGNAELYCQCFTGYTGADCSVRQCPRARAWIGYAKGTDDVHEQLVECAGMGTCVRALGVCRCQAGFEGAACERMACPGAPLCSGSGRCLSLRQAAAQYDGFRLTVPPIDYDMWDADRIYGCVCDVGHSGYDCGTHTCPAGDDPLTPGTPETQQIVCSCGGGDCGGYFAVAAYGRQRHILATAVARVVDEDADAPAGSGYAVGESVEAGLNSLQDWPWIDAVSFSNGFKACGAGNTITVNLKNSAGNAPEMLAYATGLTGTNPSVAVSTPAQGTTESIECSGRGECVSGACNCFTGYYPSDGNGGPGMIPDCGSLTSPSGITSTITACASAGCSGHGMCQSSASEFKCKCNQGYAGPRCEFRQCPQGRRWWSEPTSPTSAHPLAECSGAGLCDRSSGRCACFSGFNGAACDRVRCPSDATSNQCSGHGVCTSLRDFAALSRADGKPVGNAEIQQLTCSLTAGTFTLKHRYASTVPIAVTADAAAVKAALEALPTIGFVNVRLEPGATTVCAAGGVKTQVTFTTDVGDQPLLVADTSAASGGTVDVEETTQGSRASYGEDPTNPATWDADMIFGCHCDGYPDYNYTSADGDLSRWFGNACTDRRCPYGADPLAPLPAGTTTFGYENQTIACSATGGSFTLSFRGQTTVDINYDDTTVELQRKLQALSSIGLVLVTPSPPGAGGPRPLCEVNGGAPAETIVTFRTEIGNVPLLETDGYKLTGAVSVTETDMGTGQLYECSRRGVCDYSTALCKCVTGWWSSDGAGRPGARGDCGHYDVVT